MNTGYTQPTLFEQTSVENERDPQIEADRLQAYRQIEAQPCECLHSPLWPWKLAYMCSRCKRMYEIEEKLNWLRPIFEEDK